MKKSLLSLLVSAATVCACAFCITACGEPDSPVTEPEIGPTPVSVETINGTDYIGVTDYAYEDGKYVTEFKLDGGDWVYSDEWIEVDGKECYAVWRDLTPGSVHTVYARFKTQENGEVVSGDSFSKEITLDKRASDEKPEVTVSMTDGKTVKINGFTQEMQASFKVISPDGTTDGSDGYTDSDTFTFSKNGNVTVNVRFKDTATTAYGEYAYTSLSARATDFGGGTGSEEDPFIIRTLEQLIATGEADYHYMPSRVSYFRLENDIDCSALEKPVKENSYSVYVDGNGKKLTGVDIAVTAETDFIFAAGVFEKLYGAENLTVENAKITVIYDPENCDSQIGLLAGQVSDGVKNCRISGSIEIKVNADGGDFPDKMEPNRVNAGGFAGIVWGDIEGCSADVDIILPSAVIRKFSYYPYCGGLAGSCVGNIVKSSSEITVKGGNGLAAVSNGGSFGGLAASGVNGKSIENSYASVRFEVTFAVPHNRASVNKSYIGGLAGETKEASVKNSYANGMYIFEAEQRYTLFWGGLIGGSVKAMENCFADANEYITADRLTSDALSASFESEASVTNCYFNSERGETAAASGAAGVETETLRSKDWQLENLGWDEGIWQFHDYRYESEKFYPTHK